MDKKLIKLTESDLHKIVEESVARILKEGSFDMIRNSGWQEKMNQIGQLARECVELAKDESPNGFGETALLTTAMQIVDLCKRWGA